MGLLCNTMDDSCIYIRITKAVIFFFLTVPELILIESQNPAREASTWLDRPPALPPRRLNVRQGIQPATAGVRVTRGARGNHLDEMFFDLLLVASFR